MNIIKFKIKKLSKISLNLNFFNIIFFFEIFIKNLKKIKNFLIKELNLKLVKNFSYVYIFEKNFIKFLKFILFENFLFFNLKNFFYLKFFNFGLSKKWSFIFYNFLNTYYLLSINSNFLILCIFLKNIIFFIF